MLLHSIAILPALKPKISEIICIAHFVKAIIIKWEKYIKTPIQFFLNNTLHAILQTEKRKYRKRLGHLPPTQNLPMKFLGVVHTAKNSKSNHWTLVHVVCLSVFTECSPIEEREYTEAVSIFQVFHSSVKAWKSIANGSTEWWNVFMSKTTLIILINNAVLFKVKKRETRL